MSFFRGFKYAFCGIIHCIKNERNMRIHTVAALYVLVFARFFDLSREDFLLLLLTIGGVISAEMINTAIEELCDKVSKEYHPLIKAAKDTSAGAVLILAIFAFIIGIILFGNFEGLSAMYNFYAARPLNLCGIVLLTAVSIIYIAAGPVGIKNFFIGRCGKKTNGGKYNVKRK